MKKKEEGERPGSAAGERALQCNSTYSKKVKKVEGRRKIASPNFD